VKRINYFGKRFGDEKNRAISSCDIFVFPTFYDNECFPLVILEAMQQCKPIITSTEGGIPDIVTDGQGGYTVSARDADMIANKIAYLLTNPDILTSLGEKNQQIFEDKFTLDVFEHNITKIFQNI